MNKLFQIVTIHCHRPKNAAFNVENDVISGVLFHLKCLAYCDDVQKA